MEALYTVGYEGTRLDQFVDLLQRFGIGLVVDIREKAFSRKPGFSKAPLSMALARRGIRYMHIPELGSPSDIRRELHKTWDYRHFFQKYRSYLLSHKEVADALLDELENETACLMCFEHDPLICHRKVVADYLIGSAGLMKEVQHI